MGNTASALALVALLHAPALQKSEGSSVTGPALRVIVETELGSPVDLGGDPLCIQAYDEQGWLECARPTKDRSNVAEIAALEPGRYWLVVHVPRLDRVVHTISIDAHETREEHVQLRWSDPGPDGAVTMEESRGRLSWSDSYATGSVALWVRPMSPDGKDLATEGVVCAREGLMNGMRHEFAAGPIDITLASCGTGRLLLRARGFAPTGIDLDFSDEVTRDVGTLVLEPARRVRAKVVLPEGLQVKGVGWEYAARAEIDFTRRFWTQSASGLETELELGDEPFVVGAQTSVGKEYWATPRAVVDPAAGGELVLPLRKKVLVVLEPIAVHELQEIELLDSAQLLVWQGSKYVDAPQQLWLIPGEYTLRHRDRKRQDEFVAPTLMIGSTPQRVTLAR